MLPKSDCAKRVRGTNPATRIRGRKLGATSDPVQPTQGCVHLGNPLPFLHHSVARCPGLHSNSRGSNGLQGSPSTTHTLAIEGHRPPVRGRRLDRQARAAGEARVVPRPRRAAPSALLPVHSDDKGRGHTARERFRPSGGKRRHGAWQRDTLFGVEAPRPGRGGLLYGLGHTSGVLLPKAAASCSVARSVADSSGSLIEIVLLLWPDPAARAHWGLRPFPRFPSPPPPVHTLTDLFLVFHCFGFPCTVVRAPCRACQGQGVLLLKNSDWV